MITAPMFFEEAINFLLGKEDLPAEWNAADWREQEPDFQTKAFFSSTVENARFLDRSHGLIFDFMVKTTEQIPQADGTVKIALKTAGREHFVKRMRDFMIAEGMAEPGEFAGVNQKDIKDIRSVSRLRLIFDTNVRQAYGFGQWKQGMKPAVLRAFPAARLIRDRGVSEPRPRHQMNLGEVRLKTDPRWAEFHNDPLIGGFGVPWGPYGFNSGATQEDVDRDEARSLGLDVDSVAPKPAKVTDGTQASTKKMDPAIKAKLLKELRGGPKPRDPEEAARQAAAEVRREMLGRGLADAESRGDSAKAEKYRKAIAELPSSKQGLVVHDESDRIRLDEDLGERISKARNRLSDSAIEQEKAVAEAIFERIDRKAAEPQRRPESGKGVSRARLLFRDDPVLTPEERLLLDSPYEILIVYTPEGRLKKAVMGDKQSVTIPPDLPQRSVLSHNHPGGTGASAIDLKYILSNPGNTLRIVAAGEEGTELYGLRAIKSVSDDDLAMIVAEYEELAKEGGDTRTARLDALSLILDRYSDILTAQLAILR